MDHAQRTQQSYDLGARQYLERNGDRSVHEAWFARFAGLLVPGAQVLDLGSGPCSDAAELAARGLRVTALDRSAEMLRLGAAHFAGTRVRGDLRRVPLASASFAGVWASASLLHLQRDELPAALAEARRVLAPGGALFASLKQGDGERWEPSYWDPMAERWFTYYREEELDRALHAAGFESLVAETRTGTRPSARPETWLMRIARAR